MQLIGNYSEVLQYNGYNTKIAKESGQTLQSRTYVACFPLINMNPTESDTILSTMHMVKKAPENSGQRYTIFTNDQQLFRITTQMA